MSTIMDGVATIDDLDVEDRRVLLRADFNVPVAAASPGGPVSVIDDARIRTALPTIEELLRRGARVVLVSRLDGPAGVDADGSMRPVAERLATLSGAPVPLAPGVTGAEVRELSERLAPGAMLMLENMRFAGGETRNEPRLASALAELADLYVNDAFASAHQAHASTEGVARLLPCAVGRLMEREVLALSAIVDQPARPLAAILGARSTRGIMGLVRSFLRLADVVCIGGAMSLSFLAVLGCDTVASQVPAEDLEGARVTLAAAGRRGWLALPSDLLLDRRSADLDIGPETARRFASEIHAAATVFWSGPMGRCEVPSFAGGTRTVAEAVAATSATTVVAGGEAAAALRAYGLQNRVSHVSTGRRATLEFLSGRELPALQALRAPRSSKVRDDGSLGRLRGSWGAVTRRSEPSPDAECDP